MNYLSQLENIIESKYRLVAMETYDTDRVVDLFTELSRFSSKAIYMSLPNEGMHRIGASHITIPRTQTALEQLNHIKAAKHYGVYILRDFNYALEDAKVVAELKNIAVDNIAKTIIMLSEHIDLPAALKPFTMRSKHKTKRAS